MRNKILMVRGISLEIPKTLKFVFEVNLRKKKNLILFLKFNFFFFTNINIYKFI